MIKSLNKKDFLIILKKISDKLTENEISFHIPYCHIDKENFNYIDIIIPDFLNTSEMIYTYDISNYKEEDNVLSGEIEGFKFNFIKVPVDYINHAFYFYCWNFFPYLIKAMLKPINLEYDFYGLHYIISNNKKITLTKNLQKIMDFLNMDFKKLYGINIPNKSLLKQEIINSDFFNINSFDKSILKEIDPNYKYNEKYYRDFLSIAPLTENILMENNELVEYLNNFFPESNLLERLIKISLNKDFDLSKLKEKIKKDIEKEKPVSIPEAKEKKKVKLKRMKLEDLKYREVGDTIYLDEEDDKNQ